MKYETYDFYTAISNADFHHISKSGLFDSYSDSKVVGEFADDEGNETTAIPMDDGWYVDFYDISEEVGYSLLLDNEYEVYEVVAEW